MVGIVDEALPGGKQDELGVSSYIEALVKFIKTTDTPMTIGIQGEWGSGKTSMLNQIQNYLEQSNIDEGEDKERGNFKQIWVNAWENSLLVSPEEALLKIINQIISELLEADSDIDRKNKITEGASALLKGALRVGAAVAVGNAGKDIIDDALGVESNPIKELRANLSKLVEDVQKGENPYQKVVIYVDDLDRIVPESAVRILELLKNIFNIPGCVFILAIDYQVVVKGLEEKFGKPTPENEWEFRAFFDKIIQLPFKMPMGRYSIGSYVNSLLDQISFHEGKEALDEEVIASIIALSIGGNPRSIKRLINSLSLIKMFSEINASDKKSSEKVSSEDSMLLFTCVCLQISYPEVYELLGAEPNFTEWNEEFAFKKTEKKEEDKEGSFEENFKSAQLSEHFDEEWEKALYRICYLTPNLRSKVSLISELLSLLKENLGIKSDELSTKIISALNQTAVTSISVKESPNIRPPVGSFKAYYFDTVETYLETIQSDKGFDEKAISITRKILEMFKSDLGILDAEVLNGGEKINYSKDSVLEIGYAKSGASIFLNGSKVGSVQPFWKPSEICASVLLRKKTPDFKLLKKGNLKAEHVRPVKITDEEARKHSYNSGDVNFMHVKLYEDIDQDFEDLKLMFKDAIEATEIETKERQYFKRTVNTYLNDFKSARKNSKKHKEAVDWIKDYYMKEDNYREL